MIRRRVQGDSGQARPHLAAVAPVEPGPAERADTLLRAVAGVPL